MLALPIGLGALLLELVGPLELGQRIRLRRQNERRQGRQRNPWPERRGEIRARLCVWPADGAADTGSPPSAPSSARAFSTWPPICFSTLSRTVPGAPPLPASLAL